MSLTAMRVLSPEAQRFDTAARAFVDFIDHSRYDGRIPYETAGEVYRAHVGSALQKAMLEDLAPWNRAVASMQLVSISTVPVPTELQAMIDHITTRYQRLADELLPTNDTPQNQTNPV